MTTAMATPGNRTLSAERTSRPSLEEPVDRLMAALFREEPRDGGPHGSAEPSPEGPRGAAAQAGGRPRGGAGGLLRCGHGKGGAVGLRRVAGPASAAAKAACRTSSGGSRA